MNEAVGDRSMTEDSYYKVSATTKPISLAGAIANPLRRGEDVELQAIGGGAVNAAVKAIAITRGYIAPSGLGLVCVPAFFTTTILDQEVTGIKFLVKVEK